MRPSRYVLGLVLLVAASGRAENILAGRAPTSGGGPALTDGHAPLDGSDWLCGGVVRLGADEAVVWDLGVEQALNAAAIQADNNDEYVFEVSSDGLAWQPWWRAQPAPHAGLQTRDARLPEVRARYLRLRAMGGDGRFSASEVEVFSGSTWGSELISPRWLPRHPVDVAWTWLLGAVAALLLLGSERRARWQLLVLATPVVGGFAWVAKEAFLAPAEAPRIDYLRAVAAAMAGLAVARELLPWPRARPHRGVVLGVLSTAAFLGLSCFLNMGKAQFFDAGAGRPTALHHYDMRTYYPIAKYFPELRFDGVYAASTMVVAESRGGLDSMAETPLRDLRTHESTTVRQVREHLEAVRARFTPERWAAFTEDMNYFRRAMGDGGYLGSMSDHGGNATPVWFLGARLLFAWTKASDAVLWLGVGVDMGLLALAFLGLLRAFGARTALVAMTLFGAMDFYQFGSNWFGAALRHDWLALWCLALWAFRRERFALGGGLLAFSALIRAFPALAFVTLSMPVAWSLGEALRTRRTALRPWLTSQGPFLRTLLGAAGTAAVLIAASTLVFGADAWVEWLRKVGLLDRDNHVNNLSVRTWVTSSRGAWTAIVVGSLAGLTVALRRARAETAAAWGVALVPIVFNPANYYLHSVFLLAVLAEEVPGSRIHGRGLLSWLVLLGMCVGSYFTSFTPDLGAHFAMDTFVLLAALACLLAVRLTKYQPAAAPS